MAGRKIGRPRKNPIGNANDTGDVSDNVGRVEIGEPISESDDSATDGIDNSVSSDIDSGESKFIDPSSLTGAGTDSGDSTPKRRGRKPGSRNKSRGTSATQATADVSGILFTIHLFIANFVKNEILAITKEESDQLAAAITRVTELYEIPLLSEKHMAFLNLAMVSGGIYGTRFVALSMQKKKEKANVVTMPFNMAQDNSTGTN